MSKYFEDGTPTIDSSISPFFTFIKEYLKREDIDHPKEIIESWENLETFIEEAFDLAFGEDALHRDWHPDAVIEELTSFSDKALKYDEEDFEEEES
tara:strand:+ start:66 stop:353 length:288 start_codon:yes stop_codon:yes gene_type:complete